MTNRDIEINKAIKLIAQLSVDKASQVLSKILKCGAKIVLEKAYVANITEVTEQVNAEDEDVIGAFVGLDGDAPLKFLFYANAASSLILCDLALQNEVGTTKAGDEFVMSTIQEMGNILASSVANVFSANFQINLKPTPPVVIHDFVGTIFGEYILDEASEKSEIFIIESKFSVIRYDIKCTMFMLPLTGSETAINVICNMAWG